MKSPLLCLVLVLSSASGWAAGEIKTNTGSIVSYKCPGDPASNLYHVHINGTEVFISRFFSLHYAHMACSGTVNVVVQASGPIQQFSISPKRCGIKGKTDGGDLLFSVKCDRPRYLVISIGDEQKVLLFLDPPVRDALQLGGANVVDASAWLKDSTGKEDQAGAFQSAIAAVNNTGKTLYVPPGIYLCKTLAIAGCRNFKLYLAPGCLIRTSYEDKNAVLLDIVDSQRISVFGRGVLDNQSVESRAYHQSPAGAPYGSGNTVRILNSSDVLIDGLVARNSRNWSFCCRDCDRLTIRDCKVLAPVECNPMWTDGYNITGGDTVLVENCFVWSTDDSFASGDYHGTRESTHFTIRGLVGYSIIANGIRLGFDSTPSLSDFHFEDCDFLHVKLYGITINAHEPANPALGKSPLPRMGRILVEHCGFELDPPCLGFLAVGVVREYDHPQRWNGVHVDDLELNDISLEDLSPDQLSRIQGIPADPIGKVVLKDLRVGNQPVRRPGDIHLQVENVTKCTLDDTSAATRERLP